MPDFRHRPPRRAARRRADQRHRRACARFRRCQQFDGRPSVGADRAGAVRAGGSSTAPDASSSPPMSPGSRPRPASARGVNLHHYEKGWHPTATLGVFGAAAACCHLIGLDRAKTAQALAIAASLASGIKANFGTMTKPLHVGHTARGGLFAAMLAREGFTANDARSNTSRAFCRVQRRRQFRRGRNPRRLGTALRPRLSRDRHQAASVLRQHAPGGRCDAGAARRARNRPRQGGAHRFVDASAPPRAYRPAGPAIRPRREVQRAILPGARACSTAASCSNISRARRFATRPRGR